MKRKPISLTAQFPMKTLLETNDRIVRGGVVSSVLGSEVFLIEIHERTKGENWNDPHEWKVRTYDLSIDDLAVLCPYMASVHEFSKGDQEGEKQL